MNDIAFLPCPVHLPGANIKVVGVGGAGCNALSRMIESGVSGVQFIAMNTDQQSLAQCKAEIKIPIGPLSMRGLGAGGNPERGSNAAEESREEILSSLLDADMIFIAAGLGGGTGTGAAPVIASCAREIDALAVAVVLTPFCWEGQGKAQIAAVGLENLRNMADSVIVVSNEKIKNWCDRNVKTKDAYRAADSVLIQGVRGITDLILRPGIINGDFADVKSVLCNSREALIGTGQGRGDDAILDAVRKALDCPLLERDQQGSATKIIVSVMADWDQIEFAAVEVAMNYLREHYSGQPDIKLCQAEAPELDDRVLVTVLASGFDSTGAPEDSRSSQDLAPPEPPTIALPSNTRVYGDTQAIIESPTPTRFLPRAPTPSGELERLEGLTEALHVPPSIRMSNGRLPLE
ncbi:MAG: cell division protein FtsZ [Holophagales bacterium]|jgi:cell division protein FtsZ|nr:cell division protein FtsZ [Holophagales bacterium]